EAMLKIDEEAVLNKISNIIKEEKNIKKNKSQTKFDDLIGVWSKEEGKKIMDAIEEGCEQIHVDEWK
ncbi:MAG: hypothetical protein R2801_08955, partial [Chitinophagales bacterium]